MEELFWDEYTGQLGSPKLDIANNVPKLDIASGQPVLSSASFTPNPIVSQVKTRAYSFGSLNEKRYSSVSTELDLTNSSWMVISCNNSQSRF